MGIKSPRIRELKVVDFRLPQPGPANPPPNSWMKKRGTLNWLVVEPPLWNPPTPLWRWRRAYWGANSYTKCSMTFVNIAVAISALAGGGALSRFRTESKYWWCFRSFWTIFGCLNLRTSRNGILGDFGPFWIGKKMLKFQDAFRRSILDTFLAIFYNFLAACQARK